MAIEAHAEMLRFEARRERDRARKSKGAGEINTDAGAVTEADDDAAGDGETIPTDDAGHSEGVPAESAGQDRREQNLSTPKAPKHGGFQKSGGVVPRRTRRQSTPAEPAASAGIGGATDDGIVWRNRLAKGPAGMWLGSWGPKPDEPGCAAPLDLVLASPWRGDGVRLAA